MIIAFPEKLFGIHPVTTGHVINALSGAITIVLVGFLGWRVRPAIGAIAAVLFASLPYVFDIARTAGIDLPSIALTLLYIIVGLSVVRTGSLWRAVVLGAIFAVAFLIKETILPFAVVPFILGVLWGVRWTNIVRTAARDAGVAAVGMSWWFVMFAGYTHQVYRADFPEWTLLPSAIAVAVFFVIGSRPSTAGPGRSGRGWNAAARAPHPARLRSRTVLGWGADARLVRAPARSSSAGRRSCSAHRSSTPGRSPTWSSHSLGSVRIAMAFGLGTFLLVGSSCATGGGSPRPAPTYSSR